MENYILKATVEAAPDVTVTVGGTSDIINIARANWQRIGAPKSVAKMARGNIMQFPILASADIPADDMTVIAKALEKQYAAFVLLVLQGRLNINSDSFQDVTDVLQTIHMNDDAPNLDGLMSYGVSLVNNLAEFESLMNNPKGQITQEELNGLWYGTDDCLTMESLNSMYRPNAAAIDKMEAVQEFNYGRNGMNATSPNKQETKKSGGGFSDYGYREYYAPIYDPNTGAKKVDNHGKVIYKWQRIDEIDSHCFTNKNGPDPNWDTRTTTSRIPNKETTTISRTDNHGPQSIQDINAMLPKIVPNDRASAMEPTMMTATMYVNNKYRAFVVGIKAMVRSVPSDIMVAQLSECLKTHQLAFQIIKWTKGELKFFRDIIFDIQRARADAINTKNGKDWFSALNRRKKNSRLFIGGNKNISPITTVVLTDTEVERIKANTGMDLMNPEIAYKLIQDQYLLGLIIYNAQTKTVSSMLDGEKNRGFAQTTIRGLSATNGQQTSMNEDLLKLLGKIAR